ncbi:hypothetical protein FRC04_011586 [Tulasnella sp. 424]|nr:hypothetical protein FRC04_011586 [Tulasnella sp. 424]KAG8964173.1 hypothetical protein FRC05_004274 [Tulasnella sp. 425]
MSPVPAPASSKSGKVYLTSFRYEGKPAPGSAIFEWAYDKRGPDEFSVWFYNVKTGKLTKARDNWPTRVFGTGKGKGEVNVDPLVGVVGTYKIHLASAGGTTQSKEIFGTSKSFYVVASDFET